MKSWVIAAVACYVLLNVSEAKSASAVDEDAWAYVEDMLKDRGAVGRDDLGWRSENLDQPELRDAKWEDLYRERRQVDVEDRCRCSPQPPWNPVCGSNGVTYNNREHLACFQRCGINVRRRYMGTCVSK